MYDLSIRKVPGVGRVHERLLDSIGVKVPTPSVQSISAMLTSPPEDMRRCLPISRSALPTRQAFRAGVLTASISGHRFQYRSAGSARRTKEYWCRAVRNPFLELADGIADFTSVPAPSTHCPTHQRYTQNSKRLQLSWRPIWRRVDGRGRPLR